MSSATQGSRRWPRWPVWDGLLSMTAARSAAGAASGPGSRARPPARCRGRGDGFPGPGRAVRRWPPWLLCGRRPPAGAPGRGRNPSPVAQFSPSPGRDRMATATNCAWVPSWRSRSIRRKGGGRRVEGLSPGVLERAHPGRHGVRGQQDAHESTVDVDHDPHGPGGDEDQDHAGDEDEQSGGRTRWFRPRGTPAGTRSP